MPGTSLSVATRSDSAGRNDMVTLAYRQPDSGEITAAVMLVQKEITYKGQPVYETTTNQGRKLIASPDSPAITS